MSVNPFRSRVLQCFKSLHRTRRKVFSDDDNALEISRKAINDQFRKEASETDPEKIDLLIKKGEEAELYLRKTVLQAREKEDGVFKVRITEDTELPDNVPYDKDAVIPVPRKRRPRKKEPNGDEDGCS